MKKALLLLLLPLLFACSSAPAPENGRLQNPAAIPSAETESEEEMKQTEQTEQSLRLTVDGREVEVAWEDNASVAALKALAAERELTVPLSPYGGFEQVGDLGNALPKDDRQITTSPGDIVLYAGSQIVLFYGSNAWAYTPLGRITGQSAAALSDLLGNGAVTITLTERKG